MPCFVLCADAPVLIQQQCIVVLSNTQVLAHLVARSDIGMSTVPSNCMQTRDGSSISNKSKKTINNNSTTASATTTNTTSHHQHNYYYNNSNNSTNNNNNQINNNNGTTSAANTAQQQATQTHSDKDAYHVDDYGIA